MITQIGIALPGDDLDAEGNREWLCFLRCGHEKTLIGQRGKLPHGGLVVCELEHGEADGTDTE